MACSNRGNPDERLLSQQEHRNISRHWKRVIENVSKNKGSPHGEPGTSDDAQRGVHFGYNEEFSNVGESSCMEQERPKMPSEAIQKKLAKGKSLAQIKSPLRKFDEIVTKQLNSHRLAEEAKLSTIEGKKWTFGEGTSFGLGKFTIDNKISRGALISVESDVKNADPSNVQDAALMDAIEKLAQAQAFCYFDATVRAAEIASERVPPEMAEEAAASCVKDFQAEIVDIINEKIPMSEEKNPMEVIGYIGVTKLKDSL